MITLQFERTAQKTGIFSSPIITYRVADAQGRPLLQLTIQGKTAMYDGDRPVEHAELQKSFWGKSWNHVQDTQRPFVTFSQGWRSTVILPDEASYTVKIHRKWWLFSTKDIPGFLQAVFKANNEVVFTLDNMEKRKWTDMEITAPMKGTITTSIVDPAKIAAFLLAVQYRIELEMRAAAAA